MSESTIVPEVLWAQRSNPTEASKNIVYLTIGAPDVSANDLKLDIQPTKLTFTGKSHMKKATYHVELELFAEIDPAESKTSHTDKNVELVLRKKELGEEFWPRLLKEKGKVHFLRTDFDKWVDEDEQEDQAEGDDDYMSKMGGGMGGMGAQGNGFEGIDFSKLGAGGMGGMGGMEGLGGMPDMPDQSSDEEDDEDEDMPELEGEEEAAKAPAAPKTDAKIEEVE